VRHDLALGPTLECVLCRRELPTLARYPWLKHAALACVALTGALALAALRPRRAPFTPTFAVMSSPPTSNEPAPWAPEDAHGAVTPAQPGAQPWSGAHGVGSPYAQAAGASQAIRALSPPPRPGAPAASNASDDSGEDDGAEAELGDAPADAPADGDGALTEGGGPAFMFGRARGGGSPSGGVTASPSTPGGGSPASHASRSTMKAVAGWHGRPMRH
jgi:hypothetical protein